MGQRAQVNIIDLELRPLVMKEEEVYNSVQKLWRRGDININQFLVVF